MLCPGIHVENAHLGPVHRCLCDKMLLEFFQVNLFLVPFSPRDDFFRMAEYFLLGHESFVDINGSILGLF
ncbi:oxidoreductase [Colletotrichum asianum]